MNFKGQLPGFVAMFFATIVIVAILVVFVLGAGLIKKFDGGGGGVVIYDENEVKVDDIFDYMDRYVSLLKVRFFLEKGLPLEESFEESEYDK